eukprot:scaffold5101_cov403-Prasinococcus_capsulatus_cf.AAC.8
MEQEILNIRAEFSSKLADLREQVTVMESELLQRRKEASSAETISKDLREHLKVVNDRMATDQVMWENRLNEAQKLLDVAQAQTDAWRRKAEVAEEEARETKELLSRTQQQADDAEAFSQRLARELESVQLSKQRLEKHISDSDAEFRELEAAHGREVKQQKEEIANVLASVQQEETEKLSLKAMLDNSEQRCQHLQESLRVANLTKRGHSRLTPLATGHSSAALQDQLDIDTMERTIQRLREEHESIRASAQAQSARLSTPSSLT